MQFPFTGKKSDNNDFDLLTTMSILYFALNRPNQNLIDQMDSLALFISSTSSVTTLCSYYIYCTNLPRRHIIPCLHSTPCSRPFDLVNLHQ